MQNPAITYLLTTVLLLLLTGCSPPVRIESYSVSDRLVQAAQTRESAGDYQGAVDFYLRAAAAATARQHQDVLLQATTSLIQLGEYNRASTILDSITTSKLSRTQREQYDINCAKIALNRNHTRLAGGIRIKGQAPQQVALLLPLSGKLATVAAMVRDGVLAAYNDMPGEHRRPVMKVYDVSGDPASILDSYRKAVSDGAELVIGPLRKESVRILASREQLPVPVLALNYADTDALFNPSLYEFGLSPEDDAREVARRAWHDGYRRAIALIPQGGWGERVYAAYLEQWQQLGGQLLDMQRYNPDEPDHGQDIRAALALDRSEARHQQLERLLDREIAFEPRRRRDIDYIFVLATPVQGRLIRPQLDFYRAVNVPVYATSHIYTGHPDKAPDADMNGLIFCDIPWLLDNNVRRGHMQRLENTARLESAALHSRFYALGIDAWHLIPYIDQSGSNDREAYQGVTGELTLDSRQRIHRRLRWARFQNGLPVPLESTANTADTQHALSRATSGHAVRPAPSGMSVILEVRGTDRGDR